MGTVGLNFGSPTSGAGFDVSTTVASIVANLQNVETPWKTQLTSLESQDTALSSLGTLFSNLTNDITQFTDFQGILSEKTGSSSNTNILELTAANNSATAGTHTVIVNSLAQTSSGYLTPITTASDTLAGSLTIQVGSGTAQTITVGSSSNTLASLAAAINSAGIGVTAGVLTDATGSRLSLVSGTSGTGGNLTISSTLTDASNSNAALSYTSSTSGLNASLTVDGVTLSSASNTVANLIPGVTFQLLSNAPGTQVQVVIGNNNTGVESSLSALVSDYNALISSINTQQTNSGSGTAEPLYGSPTLTLLQQQLLSGLITQNPNGYLDGITNSSDALSGSITIQVGSGTAQTINVPSGANNTLAGLASAINSANIGVTANVENIGGQSQLVFISGTVGTAGALTVTSAITDTATSKALNYNSGASDVSSLTSLGISVNNDGSLTLDATSLDSLLNSDYSGVVGFFQDANSWGATFSNILTNAGTSTPAGILALAQTSDSNIESTLNADISREDNQISAEQRSLTLELTSANEILQALPSELNSANELYSAITGYNQNPGG
jgi:flagellar hook-associated protein 2